MMEKDRKILECTRLYVLRQSGQKYDEEQLKSLEAMLQPMTPEEIALEGSRLIQGLDPNFQTQG